MKRFAFLELFACGSSASGNKVLAEYTCDDIQEAIIEFSNLFPHLKIDKEGYAKVGDFSFCVAEFYP